MIGATELLHGLIRTLVAAAALAVAAGCAIVALCYALFALLRDPLGPAGAAAVTAVAMAVVALLIGMLFLGRSKAKAHKADAEASHSPVALLQERGMQLVRAQPLLAAGAGLVGAYILLRRPALLALIASNLVGMKVQKKKDRRGGFI